MEHDPKALVPLCEFIWEIMACVEAGKPDTFWRCEDAFRTLVRSNALDSLYLVDGASEVQVPLVVTPSLTLSLTIARHTAASLAEQVRSLAGLSEHCMIGVLGGSPFRYTHFVQPSPGPKSLRNAGEIVLERGEVATLRAGRDVLRAHPSETESILIELRSEPVHPVRWLYDLDSLAPLRAVGARTLERHAPRAQA